MRFVGGFNPFLIFMNLVALIFSHTDVIGKSKKTGHSAIAIGLNKLCDRKEKRKVESRTHSKKRQINKQKW